MEYIWIIFTLVAIISLLYGLSLTIGMGWAIFILDLLTQNVTSDYANDQARNPASKDPKLFQRGLWLIILGIISGIFAISTI